METKRCRSVVVALYTDEMHGSLTGGQIAAIEHGNSNGLTHITVRSSDSNNAAVKYDREYMCICTCMQLLTANIVN